MVLRIFGLEITTQKEADEAREAMKATTAALKDALAEGRKLQEVLDTSVSTITTVQGNLDVGDHRASNTLFRVCRDMTHASDVYQTHGMYLEK